MKKIIFTCLTGLFFVSLSAQDNNTFLLNADSIHKLKKAGKINGEEWFYHIKSGPTQLKMSESTHSSKKDSHTKNSNRTMSSSCDCWIPRDSSFHPVPFAIGTPPLYQNDDGSSVGMTLPFNFCLYGTNVGNASNQMYINNNGNISFGSSYSTYSPFGFPSSSYSMVAPFWGDVDTEPSFTSGGVVWYKLTPTYLIVQWDSVGVFDHTGQINTFQLIITDGNDPILPSGNNISFCYGEMQWTTGDASNGGGTGFGGSPATVGINKGDNVNYFQVSLFDNPGNIYTNPAGSPTSGVGWLVGRSFYFNSCGSGNNLPPLPTSGGASACSGDTISICSAGDTLTHTVAFTPPESNQTVTVTATSPSLGSAFSVISSTTGVNASLTFMINSTGLTPGYYNISVVATDNGSPVQTTTLNFVIHLLNATLPNPIIAVTPSVTCGNTPPVITLVNSSSYTSWLWSTGATTNTTTVASTSTVQITVSSSGCQKSGSVVVPIYSVPNPVISGPLTYCIPTATNTTIQVTQPVSGGTSPFTYNWNNGLASTYSLAATGTSTGTGYTVVVTDAHGCTGSASVTITSGSTTPLTITPRGSLCAGADTLFSSITNATSYSWSPGIGSPDSAYIVNTSGLYHLSVVINGCTVTASYTIPPPVPPTLSISTNTVVCLGESTTLTVSATPTTSAGYSFVWYQGSTVLGTGNTITLNSAGSYSVTGLNNGNQCLGTKTFQTVVKPLPTVSVTPRSGTYCQSIPDSIWSTPSGGTPPYHFSWSPGGAITQNINAATSTTVSTITYIVTVTDTNGCTSSYPQVLKLKPPHFIMNDAYVCPGNSFVFHANGSAQHPLTYTWSPGAHTGTTYTATSAGTYTVVMQDYNGCVITDTFNLVNYHTPQASFSYSPSPPQQGSPTSFVYTTPNTLNDTTVGYSWNFGDTITSTNANPQHTYANGGTYTVTLIVANEYGCLDTITKVIEIQYIVIAPNIITPNGDGINEFLAFKNLQYFNNNKIWIYNRWGTQLYHDADYKNNWTGKDYSDGTYFYILEIPDKNQTLKGFFESIK